MLAPLTNRQSHADGTLSNEEHHWLTMRAQGGFGLTMTCAAQVQKTGQGFAGQLATFDDEHIGYDNMPFPKQIILLCKFGTKNRVLFFVKNWNLKVEAFYERHCTAHIVDDW